MTSVQITKRDQQQLLETEGNGKCSPGKWNVKMIFLCFIFLVALVGLILGAVALAKDEDSKRHEGTPREGRVGGGEGYETVGNINRGRLISKIGFGSCITYHRHKQTVWTEAVIPNKPDAWIWLGDFVYFDAPINECPEEGYEGIKECRCEVTPRTNPPYSCMTGNLTSAREKARLQLLDYDYHQFLEYMCPNAKWYGTFPPRGDACERPIIGTYDDHDFGWNNGNRYLENKFEFKNLYLDSIGVEASSIRRNVIGGIEFKYRFNSERDPSEMIDIFLLDERYERDALPCEIRREWCEGQIYALTNSSFRHVWCEDLIKTGGPAGEGSCCKADEIWAKGWCKTNKRAHKRDPLWDIACDPSSERFGSLPLQINEETKKLELQTEYNWTDRTYDSPFCDVLGRYQRKWFQEELIKSEAALKLVVSGSVWLGNPLVQDWGICSSDDIECYQVAQANLIHIVNRVEKGCVIVLTGDYHISDLKVLREGSKHNYSEYYPTRHLKRPIIQAMASGMTEVTAHDFKRPDPCKGWRRDRVGLRPLGECSHVAMPAFGMVEIDWKQRIVHLRMKNSTDGSIAYGVNGVPNELSVSLDTCRPIEM